jgi:hypothetical protein
MKRAIHALLIYLNHHGSREMFILSIHGVTFAFANDITVIYHLS